MAIKTYGRHNFWNLKGLACLADPPSEVKIFNGLIISSSCDFVKQFVTLYLEFLGASVRLRPPIAALRNDMSIASSWVSTIGLGHDQNDMKFE